MKSTKYIVKSIIDSDKNDPQMRKMETVYVKVYY